MFNTLNVHLDDLMQRAAVKQTEDFGGDQACRDRADERGPDCFAR
jgi:hypothetical protein